MRSDVVHFLLEISSLVLLLPLQRSGSRSLCANVLSVLLVSVAFKLATCVLFASFPNCSSSVTLSICNKTAQLNHVFLSPRMPIMFHLDRWTSRLTVRRTSAERTNVGLAHARPQCIFCQLVCVCVVLDATHICTFLCFHSFL